MVLLVPRFFYSSSTNIDIKNMPSESIYKKFGVPSVINAAGTKTRIGGSLIRPEARDAMAKAASEFVRLSDLQAAASERISELTGAEAGYVTCGAESGLFLAAAAAIAGNRLEVMKQLPNTEGVPDEIVIPHTHRTAYDHAFRAAGASIIDVGTNDRYLGTGASDLEPWELEHVINDDTAAIGYVQKPYTEPPLDEVTTIAHKHDVPVIVDAAAELPPVENLERFISVGADIVAFSGGKAIRGPQTTGILAGRNDLIESVALQNLDMHAADNAWVPPNSLIDISEYDGVPKQGIGRSNKVGKEEIVGLLEALEQFITEDYEQLRTEWSETVNHISAALSKVSGLETDVSGGGDVSVAPEVIVQVSENTTPNDYSPNIDQLNKTNQENFSEQVATDIVRKLRESDPRVFVGADRLSEGIFSVNPMCLDDDEVDYLIKRINTIASETLRTVGQD